MDVDPEMTEICLKIAKLGPMWPGAAVTLVEVQDYSNLVLGIPIGVSWKSPHM